MKQPNIQVKDAVIENNANFHTYTIAGSDQKGDFYTRRRFSDFLKLRSAMLVEWPGCYIPSLPDKKLIVRGLLCRDTKSPSSWSIASVSCSTSAKRWLEYRICTGHSISS